MPLTSRRQFIGDLALAGTAPITHSFINFAAKDMFVHHVYFWLKKPGSKEDKAKLIEGLKKLAGVKAIRMFHIGQPAPTGRDVIDRSYSISWLTIFDNENDQESYQADPIHLKFVEKYSPLWSKVIVYDSIDV
jgi:hypothetical protein